MRNTGTGCFCFGRNQYRKGCTYGRYTCSMSVNRISGDRSINDHKKTSHTKRVNVKHPTLHNRLYEPRCTAERQTDDRDVPRRKKEKEWKLSTFWYCCSSVGSSKQPTYGSHSTSNIYILRVKIQRNSHIQSFLLT
jgi:hypothetical protein